MGDRDTGQPSRTLAPNRPIFSRLLTVEEAATRGRLIVPVTFAEFTEAFLVSITTRPPQTEAGFLEAGLQFLVGSELGADQQFTQLGQCEYIGAAGYYKQAVPGWLERIVIDARGVNPLDFNQRRRVEAQIVIYRIDRVTRNEWKGSA